MANANKPTLRIGKLPDLTPVKLTVSLDREVHQMLEDYARIYSESYGEAVKPSEQTSAKSASALLKILKNTTTAERKNNVDNW